MAAGNIALREFVDLDLLVHKEDALQAREVLLGNGYTSVSQLNAKWEAAYLRAYDELGLRGTGWAPAGGAALGGNSTLFFCSPRYRAVLGTRYVRQVGKPGDARARRRGSAPGAVPARRQALLAAAEHGFRCGVADDGVRHPLE